MECPRTGGHVAERPFALLEAGPGCGRGNVSWIEILGLASVRRGVGRVPVGGLAAEGTETARGPVATRKKHRRRVIRNDRASHREAHCGTRKSETPFPDRKVGVLRGRWPEMTGIPREPSRRTRSHESGGPGGGDHDQLISAEYRAAKRPGPGF